jgi:twitching motility protein PilT
MGVRQDAECRGQSVDGLMDGSRPGGNSVGAAQVIQALMIGGDAARRRALDALVESIDAADQSDESDAVPISQDPLLGLLRAQRQLLTSGRERLHQTLSEVAGRLGPAIARRLASLEGGDLRLVIELARGLSLTSLLPLLQPLLDGVDRWSAILALQAIGQTAGGDATALLVQALNREDLRWTAVSLLADRNATETMPNVVRLLGDPNPDVRIETVRALLVFGDGRLVPYLIRCASNDLDSRVRDRAENAARRIAARHSIQLNEADLRPVVRIEMPDSPMDRLLAEARQKGASDVHVVPGSPPAFRVHGELMDVSDQPLTREAADALILPMVPKRLRADLERDLGIDFSHVVPGVGRHRVNVFRERRGWSAVVRLIPGEPPRLRDLGLPPIVHEIASLNQGLVVVTGRSGSGKSSTMAAMVDLLNELKPVHIVTMEDPIEYLHERKRGLVNQREIGRHSESFPQALRAALREDPDVMVVGEMRDLVTMRMAVEAAETGHLVIATLHTPTAVGAVQRLIEAFPVAEQQQVRLMLADALRMVIAHTLVKRRKGPGRVGAFEMMVCTPAISGLIRENKLSQVAAQMQIARADGMKSMDVALMELAQAGEISPEDAYSKALNKEAFRSLLPAG